MPLIKPRTRGKHMVRRSVQLDHETNETLCAYAHFIGESADYVLGEVVDTVLARDKDFVLWRTEHAASYSAPSPADTPAGKRRVRRRGDPHPSGADRATEVAGARA